MAQTPDSAGSNPALGTVELVAGDLMTETIAYQALLEGHRAEPDDEEIWLDLLKAKAAMEIAWLAATMSSTSE